MMPTRKQFIANASSLKPGDHLRIKSAGHWERFIGWGGYQWFDVEFVSFDGKDAIFQSRLYKHLRFYVSHRNIKSGKYMVVSDRSEVFTVSRAAGGSKNNVVSLWEPGKLKHY